MKNMNRDTKKAFVFLAIWLITVIIGFASGLGFAKDVENVSNIEYEKKG